MAQVQVVTAWAKTKDNHDIYTKTWKPVNKPVAQILLIHGFGEHIGRYNEMLTLFAENDIECFAYDQRGWGETGAKSKDFGNNQGYSTALGDINDTLEKMKTPDVPLFLMGHSMGGALVLNLIAQKTKYSSVKLLDGVISSAPFVTLVDPPSPFKEYPLRALSKIVPSFTIDAGINLDGINRDKEEMETYKNDPLNHSYATLKTLSELLDNGKALLKTGKNIDVPIVIVHSTADPINSYHSTKLVYDVVSSKDKEMKSWEGMYHELHRELKPDRDHVLSHYVKWIKARIAPSK
ncbi:Alpha/Beta hydrolase protein [Spinellus fusiger]|nr:Alpha/Beta hydrolase protein [Spinellus fusiger]